MCCVNKRPPQSTTPTSILFPTTTLRRPQPHRGGREMTERMKELMPLQMFDDAIQAAIGSQVIARTTVKAMRKNVLAKCYGGDVSRKKKLLEKTKEGNERTTEIGHVELPTADILGGWQ